MANNITGLTVIGPNQATGAADDSDDADDEIGQYVSNVLNLLMTDSDALTITDADPTWNWTRNKLFRITNGSPSPDAPGTITVPATVRPSVLFENETAFEQTITISGQSQTPDSVPPGHCRLFYSDGANIRSVNIQYDVLRDYVTALDKLVVDQTVMMWLADRDMIFKDDFGDSLGYAKDGPVGGAVVFDVQVDGASVGSISFADTGSSGIDQTATFLTDGTSIPEVVAAGSRIEIIAPSNIQSMDKMSIALHGLRA